MVKFLSYILLAVVLTYILLFLVPLFQRQPLGNQHPLRNISLPLPSIPHSLCPLRILNVPISP